MKLKGGTMPSDKLETVNDTKDRKQVDFQGAPVDQLFHSILDPRGKLLKIPALSEQWPRMALTARYIRFPGLLDRKEALAVWRSAAQAYAEQLRMLTFSMSYDRFWCHVAFAPAELLEFLRSFSTNGTRAYDLVNVEQADDAALLARITAMFVLCIVTISKPHRSRKEHISAAKHAEIVQRFIKLPLLLDFCAFFQPSQSELHKVMSSVVMSFFMINRRLYTDLRRSLRDIGEMLFQPIEEKLCDAEQPSVTEMAIDDLVAIVGYLCDISSTLHRLLLLTDYDITAIFREVKFHSMLVGLVEKVTWKLNGEVLARAAQRSSGTQDRLTFQLLSMAKDKGMLMEQAIIDVYRRLQASALLSDPPNHGGKEMSTGDSLSNLQEVLSKSPFFAIVYEKWAPIRPDIVRLQSSAGNDKLDEAAVDILAHTIKEAHLMQKLSWDYSRSGGNAREAATSKVFWGSSSTIADPPPHQHEMLHSPVVVDSKVQETTLLVLDMLAEMTLEPSFVQACVVHYQCDLNATVDGILSGTAPVGPVVKEVVKMSQPAKVHKTELELEQPWPTVFDSREVVRPNVLPTGVTSAVIGKVYYGKRDAYEEVEDEVINDVTRQITIARVQQMYDDEYDDTYDEFESTEAYVHLNDKQDPVARELADLRKDNNVGRVEEVSDRDARGRKIDVIPVNPNRSAQGDRKKAEEKEEEEEEEADAGQQRPADPWARQMADNFDRHVARRPGGNNPRPPAAPPTTKPSAPHPPGTPQETRDRANKEKNKAQAGNHNRKDRGQQKRNQGMF